ncbi:MAG TPA: tRNA (adenosine(37)-N6)-threonylcarbamoyltransferase complex transferase subunit TsaD [Thermotogaceae bacterium]|nr:tRNA (adenosine(37)-N6)-threonylcarbamoyltransferase complex transferase subunit TsaD [Thermotogota bacterium]HEW92663.1 tRNA (adenosine(37)-N6)-threonylcarbamoyltransferase complex transferase subunit TsaD [Thermotogaceae bacterium]
MVRLLAIETSCDETAVAIVEDKSKILANVLASQIDFHKKYGGVVPEIASRKHLELLPYLLEEALLISKLDLKNIDVVAVTKGPGLVGALLVGISFAKSLAYSLKKPLIGVNHLIGHISAVFLSYPDLKPPLVLLLVSGGHTQIIYMDERMKMKILGRTRDDAAGEAFDKVARLLELNYPGGPEIDKLARNGNPNTYHFPRALMNKDNYDFSFSGLKTSIKYFLRDNKDAKKEDIAASFQEAIVDVLLFKTFKAAKEYGVQRIALVGGVAANSRLRERAFELAKEKRIELYIPDLKYCTDNAAMIARAAWMKYEKGEFDDLSLNAIPYLNLDDNSWF